MNKSPILLLLLPLLLLVSGCKDRGRNTTDPSFIKLASAEVQFTPQGGTEEVKLTTNLTATPSASVKAKNGGSTAWLSTKVSKSQITLTAEPNTAEGPREVSVAITGPGASATLLVKQAGAGNYIIANPAKVEVEGNSANYDIVLQANVPYQLSEELTPEWIVAEPAQGNDPNRWTLKIQSNLSATPRTGKVTFISSEPTRKAKCEVEVVQAAAGEYKAISGAIEMDDLKIAIASATASSEQRGSGDIRLSHDSNYGTIYHSNWDNSSTSYFPITLTYNFNNAEQIDYFIYHPRKDGSHNGHFKQVEIWAKTGDADFTKLRDDDFEGSAAPTKITFAQPLRNVKAIRFVVKSGAGDRQGFAACAEMEFYKINHSTKSEVPLDIFTDGTASQLREGVTEEQIKQVQNPLFREIAYFMLTNKYPREFRIADFRAWDKPEIKARENKTNTYSLMDNPTGIAVKAGQELIVLVGDTHGKRIALRSLNLATPGEDGWHTGTERYPLFQGINKITTTKPGLLYVEYHTPDFQNAPPIRIHFASGDVQGYFDLQKDGEDAQKYTQRLDAAVHNEYIDIVGTNAHLTFPVSAFKQHAPAQKGIELIKLYDKLVYDEQEFMGLMKYNRRYNNRAYFHAMHHAYMYSTSYRTAYNVTTLPTILNPDNMKNSSWGPAHELGHTHQTRPGLLWHGMTEVTTNIHSLWIQTSWTGKSRIQEENLKNESPRFVNRYDKAYSAAMEEQKPFCQLGDVFCNLVHFWQLQLYFSNVKGQTDFYKDLYELIRTEPDVDGAPQNQLAFVRRASQIAQADLTEFFEKWGYFRPVDTTIDDYGERHFNLTEQLATAAKAEVQALGLPRPDQPIHYICDANWQTFKARQPIVAGSKATVQGASITIPNNWKNVVAYEVVNAQGTLLSATNNRTITLAKDLPEGAKIYAIAHDGSRTLIPY